MHPFPSLGDSSKCAVSTNFCRNVMPNLFRHLFADETLKQVQGDLTDNIKLKQY